jgi:hypothetical protein
LPLLLFRDVDSACRRVLKSIIILIEKNDPIAAAKGHLPNTPTRRGAFSLGFRPLSVIAEEMAR